MEDLQSSGPSFEIKEQSHGFRTPKPDVKRYKGCISSETFELGDEMK